MYMRESEKYLNTWFLNQNSKPLVIRGARQVGKTSLVRSYCKKNNIKLIEVNFEEIQIDSFSKDHFSIEDTIFEIEILKNEKIDANTILFFDEIQAIPKAYQYLRFFKEKRPDLKVIAAGSLLEMMIKQEKISVPVGRVEYLYLYPMNFNEYLMARGEKQLVDLLSEKNPFPNTIHQKCLKYLNEYFYIGGMPETVKLFIEGTSFKEIRKIHMDIIESYRQDIRKYYTGTSRNVLLEVYDSIFKNIGEKTKFSNFSNAKSTIVSNCLDTLSDLFLIQKITHSNCAGLPVRFGQSSDIYKIFFIDIGLFNSLSKTPWKQFDDESSKDLVNKGVIAEQFVAQELLSSTNQSIMELNYWLKDKDPKKSEVDFIFETEDSVYVVEVKSGKAGTMKSLIQFMGEKKKLKAVAIKLDLSYRDEFIQNYSSFYFTKNGTERVEFKLTSFPLYMASHIV